MEGCYWDWFGCWCCCCCGLWSWVVRGSGEGGDEEGGVALEEFLCGGVGFCIGLEDGRDIFGDGAGFEDGVSGFNCQYWSCQAL